MKKALCKPCALGIGATGKRVEVAEGLRGKLTCDGCGRRRFGRTYEVTGRKKKEAGQE